MAKMFYDGDADLKLIQGKKVGILGYGSQGHAQAQNLRDSGVTVLVGLRPGSPSWQRAVADGFDVKTVSEVAQAADVVHFLLPDETQARVYREEVQPHVRPGMALSFSHGFNIHYHQIVAPSGVDVFMVAPKSPGHLVRRVYTEGAGVPALVAVHQDGSGQALALALSYAKGIGSTKAGVIETTFRERRWESRPR